MDLLGRKVKHNKFGLGEITEFVGNFIVVKFDNRESRFQYPEAFELFIQAVDNEVQSYVMAELQKVKDAKEALKRAEEEARKIEEEKKAAEQAKKLQAVQKHIYKEKPTVISQRQEGKRMIFWVFQGQSFDREWHGGYIWAPITNKAGTAPHHWTRLIDVRKGDIILHGCDGKLAAISVAKDKYFECKQPKELEVEGLWDRDGRMIECEYTIINNPIKTSNYTEKIIEHCKVKYSPFDKDGNGNMGYLYEINRDLAKLFVAESVRKNKYLESIEYIAELVAGE